MAETGIVGTARVGQQGTAQQRYRARNRARLLYQRRGLRLVTLRKSTGQPVGWLIERRRHG